MKPLLFTTFLVIVYFMVLLSLILNKSLIQGDVSERTYEFAMLRTLGYKKR